jgi:hypothetical protein
MMLPAPLLSNHRPALRRRGAAPDADRPRGERIGKTLRAHRATGAGRQRRSDFGAAVLVVGREEKRRIHVATRPTFPPRRRIKLGTYIAHDEWREMLTQRHSTTITAT